MNFLKQLYNMYVHRNYNSIYRQRVSRTILNLLVMFAVLFLVFSLKFYFGFTNLFNEFQTAMQNSPYFTIENGELNIDASQPYYPIPGYKNLIVDTTGKTNPSVLDGMTDGVLITKTKLYSKSSSYETQSFDLSTINDMSNLSSVTRNDLTSWIMNFKNPLFAIIEIILSIYQAFAKALVMLILSLILKAVSSLRKKNMNYSSLFNIAAYSFTLPVVLSVLSTLVEIQIPYFFIIYWALALIYGTIGVTSYKEAAGELPGISFNNPV